MVCASEKYASEIEIFTFGRGFRTRISRSSVQKRHFHQSMIRPFGQSDFFNRIGRKPPFGDDRFRPKLPLTTGIYRPKAVSRDRHLSTRSVLAQSSFFGRLRHVAFDGRCPDDAIQCPQKIGAIHNASPLCKEANDASRHLSPSNSGEQAVLGYATWTQLSRLACLAMESIRTAIQWFLP